MFTLFVIWANSRKFLFLSLQIVLYTVPLFGCGNGVVEVLFGKSLPDPNSVLSSTVKPQAIESTNRKVSALLASNSSTKDNGSGPLRCLYMKFSPEQKAQVARYAMESGNKRAIVRYSKQWGGDLKESTVRMWKAKFKELVGCW